MANTVAHRCYFDTNPFGKRYLKEYKLWATGVWVLDLGMKCRCPDKVHKPTVERNGAAVTGKSADLKATQTYPNKFGIAIVKAWEAGRFDPPPPTIRLHTESSVSSQGAEESDDGSPTFRCSGAASSEGGQGVRGPGRRSLQGSGAPEVLHMLFRILLLVGGQASSVEGMF